MEQSQVNQFSDLSNLVENELQKGSNILLNQIKSYNTIEKKIQSILSLKFQNEKEYQNIIHGIINGMLFDENMSIDNYFQILFSIKVDGFKTFLKILADVLDFSKLKPDKYEKVYIIFERFLKQNVDSKYLIDILLLICRNIYPGQDLTYSIINYNNNNNFSNNNHNQNINPNNEDNYSDNYFYRFLVFIKNNLNFIFENDMTWNLPGIIFIKILRLLNETHIYHHIYKLNNGNNLNENNNLNNTNINEIANSYQKLGLTDSTKKFIGELYDIQIYILSKLYLEKKEKIFEVGRELIRILIPMGNSNIEIIKTITNDLLNNNKYEEILSMPYPSPGRNIYADINIPPLMEKMILFILTSVKRSSSTYTYYINWLYREFKIEKCIGNTILVDLTRFIVTNYWFYWRCTNNDYVPRWLILSYIIKHIQNQILSSELKQVLFLDLILFAKDRDDFYLVEPAILSILSNMKEFHEISEELIEFLDCYAKHFDKNKEQVAKRINSIYEAFKLFDIKTNSNNNIENSIKESKMEEKYKNILLNLIQNKNSHNKNTNENINNIIETNKNNSNQINKNKINDINIDVKNIKNFLDITKDNQILNVPNNQINETNKNKIKENENKKSQAKFDKDKEINIQITIPKEFCSYIQSNILKNFLKEKNKKNFQYLLNDLCNYNIKTFGKSDSSIKILDSSYKSLCNNFALFFLKIFKDELEFRNFENLDCLIKDDENNNYVHTYLFDFAYEKFEDLKIFSFIADLINKIIENNQTFILHLISYVFNITLNPNVQKNQILNGINYFYQLNNKDKSLIKSRLNLFFTQCEQNFYMFFIRDFFKYGGVEFFNKIFFDDENLIYKIMKNCDLDSINTIKMSLINNNFILLDKKFMNLCKFSFRLSPSEKNIFWNLVFAQGFIPSLNLENFLIFYISLLKNPIFLSGEETNEINFDDYFDKLINSILILFKKEINEDIKKNELEKLSKKCIVFFEFDLILKKYIFQIIDLFLKNYFLNNNDRKKLFYYIAKEYFIQNNKNNNNLIKLNEILKYFFKIQFEINNNGEKNNENNIGWLSDEIKTLMNNIIKTIN